MSHLVLDAGAFVAYERGDAAMRARITVARRRSIALVTTSPIVAQVWRDGRRQAPLSMLLASTRIEAPDDAAARRAGALLARTGTRDVVDALLVVAARDGDVIATSDLDDIARLAEAARLRIEIVAT